MATNNNKPTAIERTEQEESKQQNRNNRKKVPQREWCEKFSRHKEIGEEEETSTDTQFTTFEIKLNGETVPCENHLKNDE